MKIMKMTGFVIWLTGLSAAGKSTIAVQIAAMLNKKGIKTTTLDGDKIRENLTKGLGFSKKDRYENIRMVACIAKLLSRNGVGVISAFISPYKEMRDFVRKETINFVEIYVNAPIEICEKRDVKGLYKKAREGEIKNFTRISAPYEPPENPELELKTDKETIEESALKVIDYLEQQGLI